MHTCQNPTSPIASADLAALLTVPLGLQGWCTPWPAGRNIAVGATVFRKPKSDNGRRKSVPRMQHDGMENSPSPDWALLRPGSSDTNAAKLANMSVGVGTLRVCAGRAEVDSIEQENIDLRLADHLLLPVKQALDYRGVALATAAGRGRIPISWASASRYCGWPTWLVL